MNSTLKACIAPLVAPENIIGPHTTIERPLNSTLRASKSPHLVLKTLIGPHTNTQRPLKNTMRACIQPLMWHWRHAEKHALRVLFNAL